MAGVGKGADMTPEQIKWTRAQEVIRAAICFEAAVEGYITETEYELDASLSEPAATISVCGSESLQFVKDMAAHIIAQREQIEELEARVKAAIVMADTLEKWEGDGFMFSVDHLHAISRTTVLFRATEGQDNE
jgi:hypothetical protein